MGNIQLTQGNILGLTPKQLKQTLGGQGGQVITAYIPDPTRFTGVAGTEYGQGQAPNLRYVADTIYKQYKDASGNLFELVPSQNPAGLSDPQTYLKQISGTPQGYAQTPQQIIQNSNNLSQGWEQDIYGAVKKNEYLNILPGETEQAYYKRTGVGYSPAFGSAMPTGMGTAPSTLLSNVQAPAMTQASSSVPTAQSIEQGLQDFLKRIQTEGIYEKEGGKQVLAPNSLTTSNGQINPVITAEGLQGGGSTKAIDVSGTTPTGTTANDNAAGAAASATSAKDFIDEYLKNISVEKDSEYKTTLDALKSEISGQKSKETLLAEEEQAQGLQLKKEELTKAKGKLAALEAEFNKFSLDEQGKPITLASIQGEIQAKRNAIAGDMLLLQADVALKTDNYNDAVTAVNNAVNLKYSSAQDSINNRLKLLELIGGELSKTETAKKDAMTAWLNQQNTALSTQKAYDLALYNQKLDLIAKYGVGSTTDSLETLNQKKLGSPVYKAEVDKGTPDNLQFISGTANQPSGYFNKDTGVFTPISGGGTSDNTTDGKSLDQLDFLRTTITDAKKIASSGGIITTPTGPGIITKALGAIFKGGNTSYNRLQNLTDTLKTNVLSLMTNPDIKKFFGPQMSNADVKLMMSTGSTLNPDVQSSSEYITEINRLDNLLNRMQTAVKMGVSGTSNVITAPDGQVIEIID